MELTNLQKEKVDELVSLYNPNSQIRIDFKAPTGSGKTLMATAFISELIVQNSNDNFVFVIATPSSADLPYSFEQKILQYKQDLPFSSFDVEYIKSPSETGADAQKTDATIRILPEYNKVFIFGKSSFGRNRILTTRGVISDFVNSTIDKGYKLIYIRDEAHIGGNINANDIETFESIMQDNASLIIKMTATPDYRDQSVKKVILSEDDLNDSTKNDGKYLLKTKAITLLNGVMTDEKMLDNAIDEFKKIKRDYETLKNDGVYIKPALLVQVDNKSNIDAEQARLFDETLRLIKQRFEQNHIKYAQYFGDNDKESNTLLGKKFSLDEISKNDSDFDAVIFKIGPATGWDIPRACMLLQLRNVCSSNLNIQTIGRIKRNCYKNLEKNDTTDKYYIYNNNPQENNIISILQSKVKEKFATEEFISVKIIRPTENSETLSKKSLSADLLDYLNNNKNKIIQSSKDIFSSVGGTICFNDIHISTSSGQYVSETTNVFQFIKIYNNLIKSNEYIFNNCEKTLSNFWKNELTSVKIGEYPFTIEMFNITIIKYFKNDILNIINKNTKHNEKYEVVSSSYDPKEYTEIHTTDTHKVETIARAYLFDNKYRNNGTENNEQPLGENDNSPEVQVFNLLKNAEADLDCIKVWGKNFTSSNVNGAYIDEYNNIKRSFFDFIVKFNNDALLYIEVKGEDDINPEKTKLLRGAYKDYFERTQTTIFDKTVVLSIFKVNTRNNIITAECFYDKELIKNNLDSMSVQEIIKTIGSL